MDVPAEQIRITRRSGKVRVIAEADAPVTVEGGTMRRGEEGGLEVRPHGGGVLVVRCPQGSDLVISTASGAIDVRGRAGSVKVTTKSGDLGIEHAAAVDARGASGRVELGACDGVCHLAFVSSNVRIGEAGRAVVATVSGNIDAQTVGDAEVKSVSGNIRLGTRGSGRVRARSISGSVTIGVPAGSRPSTRLKALSGHVRSDCEQGHDGEVSAATVSGTISVEGR